MSKVMRDIIEIDESKCDGCGLCIPACEEGALQVIEGKARLIKDVYCDGLGNCLGDCPRGAIEIVTREAEPFDEQAVEKHLKKHSGLEMAQSGQEACCSSRPIDNIKKNRESDGVRKEIASNRDEPEAELSHWPVQLHLVSPQSRFLHDADLLIAADCVPFAFADFHHRFLAGKSLVIGCPKLDDVEAYHQKLVDIFKNNKPKSIHLVHMEVGCCFGLSGLVKSALREAGSEIALEETVIGVDGSIKEESRA